MDIKDIEAFLALAEHLNFTKSAERMYISQPAFSRQITRIEDEMGCDLFIRNKRKVELTEYGRAFKAHAERIYSEYEKWGLQLGHMKDRKEGRLRIGFLQDLVSSAFTKTVRTFSEEYPAIDLVFSDGDMTDIIDDLKHNRLDLGFSLSTEVEECEGIESIVLATMPQCIVLAENHPLAGRERLSLEELSEESFITISAEGYKPGASHFHFLCREAGYEPRITALTSMVSSLLILVKCGVGIAILAQDAKHIAPEGIRFIPIDEERATIGTLICWKQDNLNPALRPFLETAEKVCAMDAMG